MSVPIPQLFDMPCAGIGSAPASYDKFAFLKDEAALRLADRVELMRRDFDLCLDVGAHDGRLWHHLSPLGKIGTMVQSDPAANFSNYFFPKITNPSAAPFAVHDFTALPFADKSFDAVFSCLNFHWINDLPALPTNSAFTATGWFVFG